MLREIDKRLIVPSILDDILPGLGECGGDIQVDVQHDHDPNILPGQGERGGGDTQPIPQLHQDLGHRAGLVESGGDVQVDITLWPAPPSAAPRHDPVKKIRFS